MVYDGAVLEVLTTAAFDAWMHALKDRVARTRITARLDKLGLGHWGDCKPVGGGVVELRIHSGPGYRLYCWQDGATVVVVVCAGDKSSQARDIGAAIKMVERMKE